MRVTSTEAVVERIGNVGQERTYTIKSSPYAFKILSSTLYKDKVQAVVRELSCNAYDSHKAAGKENVPFSVHLPNQLEPYFSVRDYGTSLSHDEIITLYTTYFESTKSDSDDFIGAMGLGSKSPFSLVDSYTIIAYNKEKRIYTAFKDGGLPNIQHSATYPSDEPQGLEVLMPVKTSDFNAFLIKARQVYSRFKVPPIVTGVSNFKPDVHESEISTKDYALISHGDSYYYHGKANAIMGQVAYPIDPDSMTNLTHTERTFLTTAIDLYFDIGELDVQAGREELSYDDTTITNIKKKVAFVLNDLVPRVQKQFDKCKTLAEAKILHHTIYKKSTSSRMLNLVTSVGKLDFKFKGKVIDGHDFTIKLEDYQNTSFRVFYTTARKGLGRFNYFKHGHDTPDTSLSFKGKDVEKKVVISPYNDLAVFNNDLEKGMVTRIRYFRQENPYTNVYVIESTPEELPMLQAYLDGIEIKNVSTLPKPPVNRTKDSSIYGRVLSKSGINAIKSDNNAHLHANGYSSSSWSDMSEIDIEDGGFYFGTKRNIPTTKDGITLDNDNLSDIINFAHKMKLIDLDVNPLYAIGGNYSQKFDNHSEWTNLFDVVSEYINKLNLNEVAKKFAYKDLIEEFFRNNNKLEHSIPKLTLISKKVEKPDSPFKAFIELVKNDLTSKKTVNHSLLLVITALKVELPKVKTQLSDLSILWTEVKKQYTMIEYVIDSIRNRYYNNDFTTEEVTRVADYINNIDKK